MTTDATPATAVATRTPRWILVVLFLSLALNLLIVGLIAGTAWRFRHGPPQGWGPPNLIGYSMSLGHDRDRALREATKSMRQTLRPLRREIQQARNDVTLAIVADPFDQARFDAAQAKLVELENKAREQTLALYAQIARQLTPEERRAYQGWREHRRSPAAGFFDDLDPPSGKGHMR